MCVMYELELHNMHLCGSTQVSFFDVPGMLRAEMESALLAPCQLSREERDLILCPSILFSSPVKTLGFVYKKVACSG